MRASVPVAQPHGPPRPARVGFSSVKRNLRIAKLRRKLRRLPLERSNRCWKPSSVRFSGALGVDVQGATMRHAGWAVRCTCKEKLGG